ncbi:hypothetical protein COLO4_32425 [Corchorus olitorius]|uniref:non-specific serine/threonine protein kinase n=1 Tax=Corchorus olitorius TaxID=93759 RepID=A0A1R3GZC8_9ROSI|nr:hypothetical protein COLO4_32425 [Corchorus olitorius]
MKTRNAASFYLKKRRKPAPFFVFCCTLVLLLLPLTNATTEHKINFNFTSFNPNMREIVFQGDAFSSDNAIQVTKNQKDKAIDGSAGWATYYKPMHLWDNSSGNLVLADFTTEFSFVINSLNQNWSADGFAFFLAPNGSTIPPNSGGGHLALENADPAYIYNKFVAVEFDTFPNYFDPVQSYHVAIDLNTVEKQLSYVPWGWSDIRNGGKVDAFISYNSTTKNLTVFLHGADDLTRRNSSSLSTIIDLSNISFPEWVTFGFAGTTGAGFEIHTINSWNFSSTLQIPSPEVSSRKKSKTWLWVVLGVVGGGVFVLVSVSTLVWFFCWNAKYRRRKSNLYRQEFGKDEGNGPVVDEDDIEDEFERETGPKKFTYKELSVATDNFNDVGKLGEGGFGGVYKGFLKDSSSYVAIKRISSRSKQGKKEYASEVKIISRLWCAHPDENSRPSMLQVLQILNFESPLPILPSMMPMPTYFAPPLNVPAAFELSYNGTDSEGQRNQFSSYSHSTNSSQVTTSSTSSASKSLLSARIMNKYLLSYSAFGSGATIHLSQEAFPIIADPDADYSTMEGNSGLFHKSHSAHWKIRTRKLQDRLADQGTNSSSATILMLQNHCNFTVWPAYQTINTIPLGDGGFALSPNSSTQFHVPPGWTGRLWGRTGCTFDKSGSGKCNTGDCGGVLACKGGGEPPVTLVEFTIDGSNNTDYYDVSLVDGYNVPLVVNAVGGLGDCQYAGCFMDLNTSCPAELRIIDSGGSIVACKSACLAFATSEFCCTGNHATPETCLPTNYSKLFKNACPTVYTYPYDDDNGTMMTCMRSDYLITFCPTNSMFVNNYSSTLPVAPAPSPTHSTIGTVSPGPGFAPPAYKKTKNSKRFVLAGSIIGALVLVFGLGFIWYLFSRRRRHKDNKLDADLNALFFDGEFQNGLGPRNFSFLELAKVTSNFKDELKLGEGGFGAVYRGYLRDPDIDIAIKRVSKASKQGIKEFASEVKIISRLRHKNLVKLIGWCHEKGELILVYEFMANGSLDSHLFKESQASLIAWVWDLYGKESIVEAADKKLRMEFDSKEMECLLMVGLWCVHPDPNLRPSIRQIIQVLNFEATLPILPTTRPNPTYELATANSRVGTSQPRYSSLTITVPR